MKWSQNQTRFIYELYTNHYLPAQNQWVFQVSGIAPAVAFGFTFERFRQDKAALWTCFCCTSAHHGRAFVHLVDHGDVEVAEAFSLADLVLRDTGFFLWTILK